MLLDLVINDGLMPKRKTAKEFASACPECGGNDRFVIFTETDRYWCRQCEKNGDTIQYLRDFHGMSFPDAAEQVGKEVQRDHNFHPTRIADLTKFVSKQAKPQSQKWPLKAEKLISKASENLGSNDNLLTWLKTKRGISADTAKRFNLGWIESNIYSEKEAWGLEPNGKKLFIPSGLVIPWQNSRVRIRRDNPGEYGRYYVLPGSKSDPYIIGTAYETTAIIVESELDAILLAQEIKRKTFIVALGNSTRKPDDELLDQLLMCPVILVALDTDEAGAKASQWWINNVLSTFRTLTPKAYGKDVTEASLKGLDLNKWLRASMELYCESVC